VRARVVRGCGGDLADAVITGVQKPQEFDITPAPAAQGDRIPGAGPCMRALRGGHRRAAACGREGISDNQAGAPRSAGTGYGWPAGSAITRT
jgi:hypothetical protein